MIASLRGTVLETSLTGAIIEVGGVGMAFRATPATLAGLRTDKKSFVILITLSILADVFKRSNLPCRS